MRFSVILCVLSVFFGAGLTVGCDSASQATVGGGVNSERKLSQTFANLEKAGGMEKATFGGGCFWCVEAVFLELKGVKSVKSGYMGGETFLTPDGGTDYSLKDVVSAGYLPLSVFLNGKEMKEGRDFRFVVSGRKMTLKMAKPVGLEEELYVVVDDPTYEQVCSKISGHAEVIQVEYDPEVISFDVLLQVFWKTHDPTTLNRQGNDVGPQYRSAVFFHNDSQREKATTYKKKLNETKAFSRPVVTEISQATKFYVAEDYHQNYFERNSGNPYCRMLIPPKLEKLKAVFGDQLKK